MKAFRNLASWVVGLVLLAVAACGGGGGGGGSSSGGDSGTLSLSLTDASTDLYRAVYITVDDIQIHLGGNGNGGWRSVDMPESPMTLDLLQLVNGVREDIGLANLPAGRYTQMRLIIGRTPDDDLNILSQRHPHANYVIDPAVPANIYKLKIPSGFNTGVKIINGFTIQANQTTELVLDFDACRSVVMAGNSGNWHLKPTIKVAQLNEYAIIRGTVGDGAQGIEGAMVSVQRYDPAAATLEDQVEVLAATVTDEFGEYAIFVAPGTYQLVAYAADREASVTRVTTATGQVLDSAETRFVLGATASGDVEGSVDLTGAGAGQYATLSFRQTVIIGADNVEVEIVTLNLMDGAPYILPLPVGSYSLVAFSYGYTSDEFALIVADGVTTLQDVTLSP